MHQFIYGIVRFSLFIVVIGICMSPAGMCKFLVKSVRYVGVAQKTISCHTGHQLRKPNLDEGQRIKMV